MKLRGDNDATNIGTVTKKGHSPAPINVALKSVSIDLGNLRDGGLIQQFRTRAEQVDY